MAGIPGLISYIHNQDQMTGLRGELGMVEMQLEYTMTLQAYVVQLNITLAKRGVELGPVPDPPKGLHKHNVDN